MQTYKNMVNLRSHLSAPTYEQRHSGLLAIDTLIPSVVTESQQLVRIAIEAGILGPLQKIID